MFSDAGDSAGKCIFNLLTAFNLIIIIIIMLAYFYCAAYTQVKVNETFTVYSERYSWWVGSLSFNGAMLTQV